MNNVLFTNFWQGLIYCLVAFIGMWFVKKIEDWKTTRFDDDAEVEKGNLAVGLSRAGLCIGFGISIAGALSGNNSASLWSIILTLIVDGAFIAGCLFIGGQFSEYVVLSHIDNENELLKVNVAVGLAEAGMFIAIGFILNGAFSGDGTGDLVTGLISAIVFYGLGMLFLCICGLVYESVTPFNVRKEIEENNAAAGLALGCMLVALGIILRISIAGDFVSWTADITSFTMCAVYGIIMLLIFRKLIDKFMLPKISLETAISKHNVAALAKANGALIAVAIIIASVI